MSINFGHLFDTLRCAKCNGPVEKVDFSSPLENSDYLKVEVFCHGEKETKTVSKITMFQAFASGSEISGIAFASEP